MHSITLPISAMKVPQNWITEDDDPENVLYISCFWFNHFNVLWFPLEN